jgi:iron complex transport system permease protein
VICCAGTLLHLIRFRINVLSLGQEEAESLGMNVRRNRWLVLACTTLITAATVALAGIVGWVGLVVPHMARMLVGSDHRKLLPVSALLGASYLILMDDIARGLTAAEIPIGILTALAGAPLFAFLLKKRQRKGGAWM